MQRTFFSILIACLSFCSTTHAAKEILLRLQPAPEAPVIAKVTASEKVLLDAAPAPKNAELGWQQLVLPTPFEAYVPVATLNKNFEIIEGTPVHNRPTTGSAVVTRVETGDQYKVVAQKGDWATVRFRKNITGYFIDDVVEEVATNFEALELTRVTSEPAPAPIPKPVAIPAPRTRVNPDEPIGQLDADALPVENVVWKPAHPDPERVSTSRIPHPESRIPDSESRTTNPIMVNAAQTQAREIIPDLGPAKTPRLLTGILEREIKPSGPGYPIRLKSPEGRLIAYVDFSEIYIDDLAFYIKQKVYIKGQIYPLPDTTAQLVILAESIRLAE